MFTPIHTKYTNVKLDKPTDWNDDVYGNCQMLPVSVNEGMISSFWKINWKDRFKLLFGYPIKLTIVSKTHPPVCLEISPDKL